MRVRIITDNDTEVHYGLRLLDRAADHFAFMLLYVHGSEMAY